MRKKSIFFSILVMIVGVWGKIVTQNNLPYDDFMRSPSSLSDSHLGQYFNSYFELPSRCIVDDAHDIQEDYIRITYAESSGVAENLRQMQIGYVPGQTNQMNVTPNFIIVKKECEHLLRNKVDETNRRYSLGEYKEIGLQFSASTPRPYCSVPIRPSDIICNERRIEDRHMIGDIFQRENVDELSSIAAAIKRPTQLWPLDHGINAYLRMYIIEDEVPDNRYPYIEFMGEGRIRRAFRQGVNYNRLRPLTSGVLKYLQYVPRDRTTNNSDDQTQSFTQKIELIFTEAENTRTMNLGGRNRPMRFNHSDIMGIKQIINRDAQSLNQYWQSSMRVLENSNRDFTSPFRSFTTSSGQTNVFPARDNESSYDILLNFVTSRVIEEANRVLFKMDNLDDVLNAASYWWAARLLRTEFGCNAETNTPNPGLERFIQTEYNHQTCRRAYAVRGFLNLNTKIQNQDDLKLDSAEVQLILSITSRKERGIFFADAFRYLNRRLERRENISLPELSLITSHYFQILEEKRRGQVLTWKGFVNFGHGDRESIESDRLNVVNFIRNFMDYAFRDKERNIGHFYFAMLLKNKLHDKIPEINWQLYYLNEAALLSYLNELSPHFRFESVENVRLYEISKFYSKAYNNLSNVCTFWHESMLRRFNQDAFVIGEWRQFVNNDMSDCMELVPAWLERLITTNGVEHFAHAQHLCVSRQDALSCRSIGFNNENRSDWTIQRWLEFFSMPRLTQSSANEGFEIVLAKWQEVEQGNNRALKAQWQQFINQLEQILADKVSSVIAMIPDRQTFASCISVENWNRLVTAEQVFVLVPELSEECGSNYKDELRNFIVAMAYMTKNAFANDLRREGQYAENITYFISTPVRVYNRWLYLTKNKRITRKLSMSTTDVDQVRARLGQLMQGRNVSFGRTDVFVLNYGQRLSRRESSFYLSSLVQDTYLALRKMQECLRFANRNQCSNPRNGLFFPEL